MMKIKGLLSQGYLILQRLDFLLKTTCKVLSALKTLILLIQGI